MRFAGIKLSNYMDSPDYGLQAQQVIKSRGAENRAGMVANYQVASAEQEGQANLEAAKYGASATRAEGQAAGNSAIVGGVMDGIGTIGSSFIKKPKTGTGTTGTPKTYGPKTTPVNPATPQNFGSMTGISTGMSLG